MHSSLPLFGPRVAPKLRGAFCFPHLPVQVLRNQHTAASRTRIGHCGFQATFKKVPQRSFLTGMETHEPALGLRQTVNRNARGVAHVRLCKVEETSHFAVVEAHLEFRLALVGRKPM